jgi:death-on-curing protein
MTKCSPSTAAPEAFAMPACWSLPGVCAGRPENLYNYTGADVFRLSAAYALGLVKDHPFIDGNKRTAFLAAYLFLRLNGWRLVAAQPDSVEAMLRLADGTWAETAFADWLRSNARPEVA